MDKNKLIAGQSLAISVTALRDDVSKQWEARANVTFGVTYDKERWAVDSADVKAYDSTPEAAIATTMLSISNRINDPELVAAMVAYLEDENNVEKEVSVVEE